MSSLSLTLLSAIALLVAGCSALVNPAAGGHLANLLEIRQVVPPPPPGPGGSGSGGGGFKIPEAFDNCADYCTQVCDLDNYSL